MIRPYAVGLVFLLAACTASSSERARYRLNTDKIALAVSPHTHHHSTLVIRVAAPVVQPSLNKHRIQAQTAAGKIVAVDNAGWSEPLNMTIETSLIKSLERSGLFAHVLNERSPAPAQRLLQTQIERFTIVYESPNDRAHVEIALHLDIIQTSDNSIVLSKSCNAQEFIENMRMAYVIPAFEKGLQHCINDWLRTIDTH